MCVLRPLRLHCVPGHIVNYKRYFMNIMSGPIVWIKHKEYTEKEDITLYRHTVSLWDLLVIKECAPS